MLGVDEGLAGCIGRCFSNFSCFRKKESFTYSVLAEGERRGVLEDDVRSGWGGVEQPHPPPALVCQVVPTPPLSSLQGGRLG